MTGMIMKDYRKKILTWDQARKQVEAWRKNNKKIAFTNGCFDLLHIGHLRYLNEARRLGDYLVVGVNSDASVSQVKDSTRPITPQDQRAEMLAGLAVVDAVVIFDEPDPYNLIARLKPDFLVKGGDWPIERIIGREVVEAGGGRVLSIPLTPDISTTTIIERIRRLFNKQDG